jgi:hypothetical protein
MVDDLGKSKAEKWWLTNKKNDDEQTVSKKHWILQYPTTNPIVNTLYWYDLEYPPNGENEVSLLRFTTEPSMDRLGMCLFILFVVRETSFEVFGVFSLDVLEVLSRGLWFQQLQRVWSRNPTNIQHFTSWGGQNNGKTTVALSIINDHQLVFVLRTHSVQWYTNIIHPTNHAIHDHEFKCQPHLYS